MSVKDTKCDETPVETEGKGDRQAPGFELPDCCRPMIERMMKAVGSTPENETGTKEGDQDSAPADWRKTMMAEVMRTCCGPQEGDSKSAEKKPGSCCGEPG